MTSSMNGADHNLVPADLRLPLYMPPRNIPPGQPHVIALGMPEKCDALPTAGCH